MKKQYFINANIIDPHNSINELGGLIIGEDGKIEAVGKKVNTNNLPTREKPVDLKGKHLFPGLVDMRVFVGEPGFEYKENFRTLSDAALSGGVTSVVTMPNTNPIIDNVSIVDFLKRRGRDKSKINIFPCASLTKNIEGSNMTEFGLLQKKGIIAFTDGIRTIQNPRLMSRIMNSAKDLGCLIMQHAEDYELAKNGMINSGIIATKLGLSGIPEIAERVLIERDLTLLEKVKCRYHISQLSSQKSVEVLKHRKEIVKFSSGVSINNLSLNENDIGDFRTFLKLSPPLRREEDRLALIQGLKSELPGIIVSEPEASIYCILDFKDIVDTGFDSDNFVNFCAQEGAVNIENNQYTVLLAPMKGFYRNSDIGKTQVRLALVEDPSLLSITPKIISILFKSFSSL